jgi:hypothetical protein
MKFNIPSKQRRIVDKSRWHKWFAWRPVRVDYNDVRWLEFVFRKGSFDEYCPPFMTWEWQYKAIQTLEEKDGTSD